MTGFYIKCNAEMKWINVGVYQINKDKEFKKEQIWQHLYFREDM